MPAAQSTARPALSDRSVATRILLTTVPSRAFLAQGESLRGSSRLHEPSREEGADGRPFPRTTAEAFEGLRAPIECLERAAQMVTDPEQVSPVEGFFAFAVMTSLPAWFAG